MNKGLRQSGVEWRAVMDGEANAHKGTVAGVRVLVYSDNAGLRWHCCAGDDEPVLLDAATLREALTQAVRYVRAEED